MAGQRYDLGRFRSDIFLTGESKVCHSDMLERVGVQEVQTREDLIPLCLGRLYRDS